MNPAYFFDANSGMWLYGNADEAYAWDEATGEWIDAGQQGRGVLAQNNWDSAAAEAVGAGDGGTAPADPMGDWQSNYGTAGRNVVTPFSTNNVDQMAEQNRLAARDWWNILDQDTRDAQNRAQDAEGNFLRRSMSSYDPIFRGQGGFAPNEASNILQENRILNSMATPEDLSAFDMAEWERDMVLGNPWAPVDEAKGALAGVRSDVDTAAERVRGVTDAYGNRVEGAIDPTRLRMSDTYNPEMQSYIDDAAESYSQVIDPRLLGLSDEFLNDYNWTERDTQDLMDKAATSVANRGAANRDYIERAAAQSGNYSPEALAAGFARGRVDEDTAAAKAILDARMAGRGRALDVTGERERMRLDTERDYTGRMTDAVRDVTGLRLNQGQAAEQMRLDAERGLSDRQVSGYGNVANMAMQGELNIGNAYRDLGQYGTGVIYDATRYGDTAMRQGGQQAYQNRLNAGQARISTRFGQAMDASNALSNRYGTVYGQKKAEEAEGRGYLTGQQNAASGNAQAIRGQRIGAAGTGLQGIGEGTQAALASKYIPSALEKGVGLALGAISAGAKKP